MIDYEEKWGAHQATVAVLAYLESAMKMKTIEKNIYREAKKEFQNWFTITEKYLDSVAEQFPEFTNDVQKRFAQRTLLYAKNDAILNQVKRGMISASTADKIIQNTRKKSGN